MSTQYLPFSPTLLKQLAGPVVQIIQQFSHMQCSSICVLHVLIDDWLEVFHGRHIQSMRTRIHRWVGGLLCLVDCQRSLEADGYVPHLVLLTFVHTKGEETSVQFNQVSHFLIIDNIIRMIVRVQGQGQQSSISS